MNKRGRPKLKVSEKKYPVTVRLAPNEHKMIKKASKQIGIKPTTFVRYGAIAIATEVIAKDLNRDDLTY